MNLSDTFTDSDGVLLPAHAMDAGFGWTAHAGNFKISGNKATLNNTGECLATCDCGNGDASVACNIVPTANGYNGVVTRFQDASNYWMFRLQPGALELYIKKAGNWTLKTSVAYTPSAGTSYELRIDTSGTSLTCYLNGVQKLTFTSSELQAAHRVGLRSNGPLGDTWENFVVTATGTVVSTLTAGVVTFDYSTDTTINLHSAAAMQGNSPYTYQWYRSTTPGFTPGAGNLLSGATSLTLADSDSLSANTLYYYRLRSTDSLGATVDSLQIMGSLWAAPLAIGFIGDSITQGHQGGSTTAPPDFVAAHFAACGTPRKITCVNRGISGTSTPDWLSGSTNLVAAKSAFAAAGATVVCVVLGTNDSHAISPASYGSNLASMVNDLVASGYIVVLNYSPCPNNNNPSVYPYTQLSTFVGYQGQIDALVNGTTILQGDRSAFEFFGERLLLLQDQSAHPTDAGNMQLGLLWSKALREAGF